MALSGVTNITGLAEEAKKKFGGLFGQYGLYTVRRDKIVEVIHITKNGNIKRLRLPYVRIL